MRQSNLIVPVSISTGIVVGFYSHSAILGGITGVTVLLSAIVTLVFQDVSREAKRQKNQTTDFTMPESQELNLLIGVLFLSSLASIVNYYRHVVVTASTYYTQGILMTIVYICVIGVLSLGWYLLVGKTTTAFLKSIGELLRQFHKSEADHSLRPLIKKIKR